MVWCGVVWCGAVRCGVVWCGVVWCGVGWGVLVTGMAEADMEKTSMMKYNARNVWEDRRLPKRVETITYYKDTDLVGITGVSLPLLPLTSLLCLCLPRSALPTCRCVVSHARYTHGDLCSQGPG